MNPMNLSPSPPAPDGKRFGRLRNGGKSNFLAYEALGLRRKGLTFRQIRTAMNLRGPERARQLVAHGERLERQSVGRVPSPGKNANTPKHRVRAPDLQRACRECGCTDNFACRHPQTGIPCHWVQRDLCSVCAEKITDIHTERHFALLGDLDSQLDRFNHLGD